MIRLSRRSPTRTRNRTTELQYLIFDFPVQMIIFLILGYPKTSFSCNPSPCPGISLDKNPEWTRKLEYDDSDILAVYTIMMKFEVRSFKPHLK